MSHLTCLIKLTWSPSFRCHELNTVFYLIFFAKMPAGLTSILAATIISTRFAQVPWPGCATNFKAGRRPNRDWRAWYKHPTTSATNIKVYIYRDPPFNWAHKVSKPVFTNRTHICLSRLFLRLVPCRTAPAWTSQLLLFILVSSIPMTVSNQRHTF